MSIAKAPERLLGWQADVRKVCQRYMEEGQPISVDGVFAQARVPRTHNLCTKRPGRWGGYRGRICRGAATHVAAGWASAMGVAAAYASAGYGARVREAPLIAITIKHDAYRRRFYTMLRQNDVTTL